MEQHEAGLSSLRSELEEAKSKAVADTTARLEKAKEEVRRRLLQLQQQQQQLLLLLLLLPLLLLLITIVSSYDIGCQGSK